MQSTDREIYIVIDGIQYKVESSSAAPTIKTESLIPRLINIEQTQQTQAEILTDINTQLAVQTSRIDMLIYGGGILFTVLCALIAYTSLFAPKYWAHSDKKDGTEKQVQPIVIQLPPYMPAQEVKEKESA